jgi:NADH-quinone oxidoreductase subunit E
VLKDEEIRDIRAEMGRYPTARAAAPEALRIVQRYRGWVSTEAVRDIAAFLGLGAEEVEGVATFYNLIWRRPVGRHVILVCDSVSCWIMGYEGLKRRLEERLGVSLGQTTPDGRFTLLPVGCLGACHRAPAMIVDGDLHENLTAEALDRILEEYH